MDDVERKRETRRQRALERLGTDNPFCVICGETDWRVLERHHVAGQEYDDLTVIHCRNCHRKVSDAPKDYRPPAGDAPPPIENRVAQFLRGLADLLELLIKKLREYADELIKAAYKSGEESA